MDDATGNLLQMNHCVDKRSWPRMQLNRRKVQSRATRAPLPSRHGRRCTIVASLPFPAAAELRPGHVYLRFPALSNEMSCTCAHSDPRTSPRPRLALALCTWQHICGSTAPSSCGTEQRSDGMQQGSGEHRLQESWLWVRVLRALVKHVRHRLELGLLRRLHPRVESQAFTVRCGSIRAIHAHVPPFHPHHLDFLSVRCPSAPSRSASSGGTQ